MASLVDIVPWCRMHMRPLQLYLLYHYHPRKDVITKLVPVNDMIRWLLRQNLLYGTSFPQPSPSVTLTTDALESGWGAHLDDIFLAGTWSPAEQLLHINHLELLAVLKTLQSLNRKVANCHILVKSDNSIVVSYLNRQWALTLLPCTC